MKKANKVILLGFQIVASPFLAAALLEWILQFFGYHLYLFGQVGRSILFCSITVIIMLEAAMLLVLTLFTGKLRYFLPNLLLIPLFLLLLLIGLFNPQNVTRVHSIDRFDEDVVVENKKSFLSGHSVVYQKELPFVVREMTEVYGSDGWCPLCEESAYEWSVSGEELLLTYCYYGYGEQQMRFRYQNGKFVKIADSLA